MATVTRLKSLRAKLSGWFRELTSFLTEYYAAPYRGRLLQEKRDEEYLIQLCCFMELLGVENPLIYYTWELQAVMLEDFHNWHRAAGMDKSPFSHVNCC
ncbi:MAG: hypothetical protein B0D92_02310 [Spirochaeta sp. LUC14_002_19_P3]|nr:MAG: hypothetical protein B0D92_02310 [Spirochaeta sp. LUC14_002_19_P3]